MADSSPLEISIVLGASPGSRLDKALGAVLPEGSGLSRSRLVGLIKAGHLRDAQGTTVLDLRMKPQPGAQYVLTLPEADEIEAGPENIPLHILHEDDDLIVVNKPAGMVVHPAPGAPSGTLVNALLYHCAESLSGIGGAKRPGIVHRIDKDTSGLLVVAKTDKAHQGLSAQFADHSIERLYDACLWGCPDAASPRLAGLGAVKFEDGGIIRITANIARHPHDRKKMAVVRSGGRHAVTRVKVVERFGEMASCVTCRLETGRTHQIRVHLTHIGHPLVGDPTYGRARIVPKSAGAQLLGVIEGFKRQALHARSLGFLHPLTGQAMSFETDMPEDMQGLRAALATGGGG